MQERTALVDDALCARGASPTEVGKALGEHAERQRAGETSDKYIRVTVILRIQRNLATHVGERDGREASATQARCPRGRRCRGGSR